MEVAGEVRQSWEAAQGAATRQQAGALAPSVQQGSPGSTCIGAGTGHHGSPGLPDPASRQRGPWSGPAPPAAPQWRRKTSWPCGSRGPHPWPGPCGSCGDGKRCERNRAIGLNGHSFNASYSTTQPLLANGPSVSSLSTTLRSHGMKYQPAEAATSDASPYSPDGLRQLLIHNLAAALGAGAAHQQDEPRRAAARRQAATHHGCRNLHRQRCDSPISNTCVLTVQTAGQTHGCAE